MKQKLFSTLSLIAALSAVPAFAAPPPTPHPLPSNAITHGRAHEENPEHAGKAEHEEHELGPINWFDFGNKEQPPWGAYAVNFALLVALYAYYGKDAIKKGLLGRRERIKGDIDEAQKLLKEAEKRAKRYQKKLDELDADAEAARKALIDAGYAERERIVRDAREKAARMERDAHLLLESELKQAKDDLIKETMDRAISSAEEIIKKTITPADHERLAEEYLAQLQAMSASDLAQKRGSP